MVAEGSGHCRDTLRLLEETGIMDVLAEDRIPFVDLNYDDIYTVPNAGGHSRLKTLTLPLTLRKVDWIVSMAKLKTHHWAGVTLSMKNLFGLMPGSFYGWPKNVLHHAGIEDCILDINATVRPHFAIVDGIVGMEGDGPIMGTPKAAGVIVMGRNFPAVDATCARIMGIDPQAGGIPGRFLRPPGRHPGRKHPAARGDAFFGADAIHPDRQDTGTERNCYKLLVSGLERKMGKIRTRIRVLFLVCLLVTSYFFLFYGFCLNIKGLMAGNGYVDETDIRSGIPSRFLVRSEQSRSPTPAQADDRNA